MKLVIVGDIHVPCRNFREAIEKLNLEFDEIVELEWKVKDKEDFQKKILNIEKSGSSAEEPPQELYKEIADAHMLLVHFCPIPKEIIEKGKKLKLIGTCRGGLEHIDVQAATENNIPVMHVIRNAEPVADFTLGLILSETRNISRSHEGIKRGCWRKEFVNSKHTTILKNQKVGLVGLGHIGKLMASKLTALGVEVIGYDPYVNQEELKLNNINIEMVSLETLFEESDIVSLHLRLTEETEGMVNKELLSLMKPTSYIINTSRAGVVKEEDLIEVLERRGIMGAALDVFWEEPLSEDSPLLDLDNVTLTSHLAGDTVDAIPKSPKLLVEEINYFYEKGISSMIVNLGEINLYNNEE